MQTGDQWFATFQHLNRARAEAYEAYVEAQDDRLTELASLSARWRGLAEFWRDVRDDPATPFLLREAADLARIHASERAARTADHAVRSQAC